ncbi:MAG: oxidoreductase [Actinomycetota bacterium]|nr:oxidoreductase [Actinomycetota bacterium]
MSWTQTDIPDQSGRVAVVTGANGGLGLQTALALAGAGGHVVMAARNLDKAERARREILDRHPDASLKVVELDLADLASVASAAASIRGDHEQIDLLVNNAGLMAVPEQQTADGFEMQLGVDHLGHFALTAHLLPALLRAPDARVVTVTSVARFMGRPVDPAHPHLVGRYGPWRAYAQAKWANYHFGLGLQRKLAAGGARAQSLIAHPGLTHTDLQSTTVEAGGAGRAGDFFHALTLGMGMAPEEGARPQLRAATDPAARGGELYAPALVSTGPAVRRPLLRGRDARRIAQLWELSERETGVVLDVPAAVAAAAADHGR